jgi:hypothetical protein
MKDKRRKWYELNFEKAKGWSSNYKSENKELIRAKYKNNPDIKSAWFQNNKDWIRDRKRFRRYEKG